GEYVVENDSGTQMIISESINPADNPDRTLDLVVADMVDQGAQLIIANSDEYKNDVNTVAPLYPDVTFVHVSGDAVLTGEAPPNVTNVMGQMEYGKAIAGCAAALATQTGKIAYLGPLINDETRRLVNSAYLGAKYCYENYRGMDGADLQFEVVWIGFWFEIPGFTLSPTEVVNDFLNGGADVVLSGIDTTEAIVVAGQRAREGEAVWAIPYDFVGACTEAAEACLGVPYFNWGPAYSDIISSVMDGSFEPAWDWLPPDWSDLNNKDTTAVGFEKGAALSEENAAFVDEFIALLATGAIGSEEGFNPWTGPLNYQDGSEYLADGVVATPEQVWYMPQLLEGVTGDSVPAE
ncbi:MAG TPA: BMP family ABC transporter substrate-binding protein, partial [Aggregatilineales bacterium]|nr:BMP family ABC transporter substrate-binding protein [Aggregatilineales bacterium]